MGASIGLTSFFNKDKTKTKQWKTAFIKSANNTPFKYNKMSRTDISRLSGIGINIDVESLIIMTTCEYEFTTDTVIMLDNVEYRIRAIYYEDDEDENNMFGMKLSTKRYLNLITDR